jgi:hypothetical protein
MFAKSNSQAIHARPRFPLLASQSLPHGAAPTNRLTAPWGPSRRNGLLVMTVTFFSTHLHCLVALSCASSGKSMAQRQDHAGSARQWHTTAVKKPVMGCQNTKYTAAP